MSPIKETSTPAQKRSVKKKSPKTTDGLMISIYDIDGIVKKSLSLPKEIFAAEASPRLLAQYIRVYRMNQRQGTAATKTRSEVVGSTKKIYRQKGTGRARHGAITAPIFVGGGIAFGPQPRNFYRKMNKKQKRKALFYAFTLKKNEEAVIGMEEDAFDKEPKTKKMAGFLKEIGLADKKVLLILSNNRSNAKRAARNLRQVDTTMIESVNPYDILSHEKVLFSEKAIAKLPTIYLKHHAN
ncbi:50S ribosomal protein L4 [Candidatus Roizmanbacteria bacterium]|nr:50S ribosomal protein L4 [Candidatus Roizmanbacteria bacterium]